MAKKSVTEKPCKSCSVVKPLTSFLPTHTGKRSWICIECRQTRQQALVAKRSVPNGQPYTLPTEKQCRTCKIIKPSEEFYLSQVSKDGLIPQCRTCRVAEALRYNATPKGKYTQRKTTLKKGSGISPERYDTILIWQKGVCGICGSSGTNRKTTKHLCVDHDHTTSTIRGLLCDPCNRALGMFHDDVQTLVNAKEYLLRHAERVSSGKTLGAYVSKYRK